MKKVLSMVLVCAVLLICSGCASGRTPSDIIVTLPSTPASTDTPAEPSTEAPETDLEPSTAETVPPTDASTPETTEEQPVEVDPTTESEPDYVFPYEFEVKELETEDQEWYGFQCEYHIPQLTINGTPCDALNKLIYDEVYVEEYGQLVLNAMAEYGEVELRTVSWSGWYTEDILSILIASEFTIGDRCAYHVYNFKLDENRMASPEEVVSSFGNSMESFHEAARNILASYIIETAGDFVYDPDMSGDIMRMLGKTIDMDNIENVIPYVGENAVLSFVGTYYFPAGGGTFAGAFPLDTALCENFDEVMSYWFGE